jgi:hypothetical protein
MVSRIEGFLGVIIPTVLQENDSMPSVDVRTM